VVLGSCRGEPLRSAADNRAMQMTIDPKRARAHAALRVAAKR
jgi:hypothetical protein